MNHHEHAPPVVAVIAAFSAFLSEDGARAVAVLVGCIAATVSLVRLYWDWLDRRRKDAERPGAKRPNV